MTDCLKNWLSNDIATDRENGITTFKLYDVDKWFHQNAASIDDCLDGCLLDNFLISCTNGVAVVLEHAETTQSSCYLVKFARYDNIKAVNEIYSIWDDFTADYIKAVNG